MITNSRRATYGYDQRIEVHGSKGVVSTENQRPVSIEIANGDGYTRPPLRDFSMTRYTEAYANEIASFQINAVDNELRSIESRMTRQRIAKALMKRDEDPVDGKRLLGGLFGLGAALLDEAADKLCCVSCCVEPPVPFGNGWKPR